MVIYRNKTKSEAQLQEQVERADLQDSDFRDLYWQLWGACSTSQVAWKVFENITRHYLKFRKSKKEN